MDDDIGSLSLCSVNLFFHKQIILLKYYLEVLFKTTLDQIECNHITLYYSEEFFSFPEVHGLGFSSGFMAGVFAGLSSLNAAIYRASTFSLAHRVLRKNLRLDFTEGLLLKQLILAAR
jgi:hypothetical protein